MPNFKVNLRKRDLGDSFEMVLDPFMFNMDMTALADIANALVDTGATKTCIGLDVVKKLGLQPIRTEAIDTATSGNEEVGVYQLLLSLCPGHFLPIEVYGIPNPKSEAVIIGMDVLGLGDLHIWKETHTHYGTFSFE
ncbi:MAG: retroviral-like aspartic protease family protein [Bacteroidaceae bacterium]|nr:retroviral-like aspartic protease family protein [Bacteroidaceae bacterium]